MAEVRLSREMRLLDITMIGVGTMIGAGIFVSWEPADCVKPTDGRAILPDDDQ